MKDMKYCPTALVKFFKQQAEACIHDTACTDCRARVKVYEDELAKRAEVEKQARKELHHMAQDLLDYSRPDLGYILGNEDD